MEEFLFPRFPEITEEVLIHIRSCTDCQQGIKLANGVVLKGYLETRNDLLAQLFIKYVYKAICGRKPGRHQMGPFMQFLDNSLKSRHIEQLHRSIEEKNSDIVSEYFQGEKGTCAICLDDIVEFQQINRVKNCSHVFHEECLNKWLNVKTNCPSCRHGIRVKKNIEWCFANMEI